MPFIAYLMKVGMANAALENFDLDVLRSGARRLNEKAASGSFAFRVAKPVHWNISAISFMAQWRVSATSREPVHSLA
jgi:hypothetical protein